MPGHALSGCGLYLGVHLFTPAPSARAVESRFALSGFSPALHLRKRHGQPCARGGGAACGSTAAHCADQGSRAPPPPSQLKPAGEEWLCQGIPPISGGIVPLPALRGCYLPPRLRASVPQTLPSLSPCRLKAPLALFPSSRQGVFHFSSITWSLAWSEKWRQK